MPKSIFPLVAFDVEDSVRLFPLEVPPTTDCPPLTPVDKLEVIVPTILVKPVEKVYVVPVDIVQLLSAVKS